MGVGSLGEPEAVGELLLGEPWLLHGENLKEAADALLSVKIGVDRAGINVFIGMNNVSAHYGIGESIEPLQPRKWEGLGMLEGDRAALSCRLRAPKALPM